MSLVTLVEVVAPVKNGVDPKKVPQKTPYIGLEHIYKSLGKLNGHGLASDIRSQKSVFQKGDVLYGRLRPYLNKVALAPFDGICSTDIMVFRENDRICAKYLYYRLLSDDVVRYAKLNSKGVQHPRVSFKDLGKIKIKLPSKVVQESIVEKLDEVFSEVDSASNQFSSLPDLLDLLYQSRLKKIFSGNFQGAPDTAINLHREIREYRNKTSSSKKLNLTMIDDKSLPNLGSAGFWASIDLLVENEKHALKAGPFGSSIKKSMYVESGYKVYGQEQVIRQDPKYGDYYIPQSKYSELVANKVKSEDVLISLVGTVGKVLVLPHQIEEGIINPRLVKVSLNKDYYLPQLFKHYFESQFVKTIYKLKTHGATMDVLNLGIIRTIPIPVFPIDKQRDMLMAIEELQTEIDKLGSDLAKYRILNNSLKQSVLSKAFKGELL